MKETEYCIKCSSINRQTVQALEWIHKQTCLRTTRSHMLSGPVLGGFITMLCKCMEVKNALEIGTFTGYGSVCIALGLVEGGHLDTLEVNDELIPTIRKGWDEAGVEDRITLHSGPALETLSRLCGPYDFVYLDGSKREYCSDFEAILPIVRSGGLILADNTFWGGKLIEEPLPRDAQSVELLKFNDMIASDARVESIMIPYRDGITLIRKK